MESTPSHDEYVQVLKTEYEKARKMLLDHQKCSKQQQAKAIAVRNLFELLQSKEAEVRQLKEKAANADAVNRQAEVTLQKMIAADCCASETRATSRMQRDSAKSQTPRLRTDDLECDGESPSKPPMHLEKAPQRFSKPSADSPVSTDIKINSTKASVIPLPTAAQSINTSSSSTNLPSMTASSVRSLGRNTYSKDLVDKLMQQNARLKNGIREILAHKNLTVSEYLEKREYEDIVKMHQLEVKRLENQISRLQAVIKSKDSEEIDCLSRQCSDLIAEVSKLERKLALQSTYVSLDKPRTSVPSNTVNRSTSPKVSETENSISYEMLTEEIKRLRDTVEVLEKEKVTLQRQVEGLLEDKKSISKVCAVAEERFNQLCTSYDSVVSENEHLRSQIAAFQEDFRSEQSEKLRYQDLIVQHQQWVRKLANDTKTLKMELETEKTARAALEDRLKHTSSSREYTLPSAVFCDGMPSVAEVRERVFTCKRCERTFTNQQKYSDHCYRCTDD